MLPPALRTYLDPFEVSIQSDPSILGVLYTGSLGRGTADDYADLDIEVWVTDDLWADRESTMLNLLARLGSVQHAYVRGPHLITGQVGPDWRRVDLYVRPRDDLEPRSDFAGGTVIKDFAGALAQAVAASTPEPTTFSVDDARFAINEAIDSQIYLALHNARGAVWSAMGEVTYRLTLLYQFLALTRGRHTYGPRYVEHILSSDEQHLITAAWPTAPTQPEVRRAAFALWTWTRYVWAESERVLNQSLDIPLDEPSLLAAIDAIYDNPTS